MKSRDDGLLLQRIEIDNRRSREQETIEIKALRDMISHFQSDIKSLYTIQQQQKVYVDNLMSSNTQYIHIQSQLSEQQATILQQSRKLEDLSLANETLTRQLNSLDQNIQSQVQIKIEGIESSLQHHIHDTQAMFETHASKAAMNELIETHLQPMERRIERCHGDIDAINDSLSIKDQQMNENHQLIQAKIQAIYEQIDDMISQRSDDAKALDLANQLIQSAQSDIRDLAASTSNISERVVSIDKAVDGQAKAIDKIHQDIENLTNTSNRLDQRANENETTSFRRYDEVISRLDSASTSIDAVKSSLQQSKDDLENQIDADRNRSFYLHVFCLISLTIV